VVMRGSEGEAVAGTKRMVQMDWIERGRTRTLSAALSGEQPVPENVARQVALILGAIDETSPATGQETAAQKTSGPRPK